MRNVCLLFAFLLTTSIYAQQAPDFTVTDSEGKEHTLYEDYLNQGKTVVIELFFTFCPPCQVSAPMVQGHYEYFGSGEKKVEFIKLSTKNTDTDALINEFKRTYGTTFPAAGKEGGADIARKTYEDGTYGTLYGTPAFIIIDTMGNVSYRVPLNKLRDSITTISGHIDDGGMEEYGANRTWVSLTHEVAGSSTPSNIRYILKGDNGGVYDIGMLTGGQSSFYYPSDTFPALTNPQIEVMIEGPAKDASVKATDLFRLRKHVLDLSPITDSDRLLAADVNSDGEVNVRDIFFLSNVVLGYRDDFPRDTPNWKVVKQSVPLTENKGDKTTLTFRLVKTGDIN